jgi:hypothetical protein
MTSLRRVTIFDIYSKLLKLKSKQPSWCYLSIYTLAFIIMLCGEQNIDIYICMYTDVFQINLQTTFLQCLKSPHPDGIRTDDLLFHSKIHDHWGRKLNVSQENKTNYVVIMSSCRFVPLLIRDYLTFGRRSLKWLCNRVVRFFWCMIPKTEKNATNDHKMHQMHQMVIKYPQCL